MKFVKIVTAAGTVYEYPRLGWAARLQHGNHERVVRGTMGLKDPYVGVMVAAVAGLRILREPCKVSLLVGDPVAFDILVNIIRGKRLPYRITSDFLDLYHDHEVYLWGPTPDDSDEINDVRYLARGAVFNYMNARGHVALPADEPPWEEPNENRACL